MPTRDEVAIVEHLETIERLRRLLDVCRESMRVTQRFHPNVTDWRGVIAAIDHEIGAKELQTP